MGLAVTDLLARKTIGIQELSGKIIAVDAPLWLYQFLTSIRGADGAPLTDAKGNVTSHLVGLLSRVTRLVNQDIKLAFVFDGTPPDLKRKTLEKRKQIKLAAQKELEKALEEGDIQSVRKYSQRTVRLTKEMINEAKLLLEALGIPVVQAPSEGEAQASHIVSSGQAYALATNDADALMFGATRIVRNLNTVGKRKRTNRLAYETVEPDLVESSETFESLGITREQFIVLGMLVGTDFNPGGVKGIGPKNALKLLKKFGSGFDALFTEVKWKDHCEHDWEQIYNVIDAMPVTNSYDLTWNKPKKDQLVSLLVEKHGFSIARVNSAVDALLEKNKQQSQKNLTSFF